MMIFALWETNFSILGLALGPFFTFMKKVVYFLRNLGYNGHVSNKLQNMKKASLSVQDINSAIISGSFTIDDINSIFQAVTFARTLLAQNTNATLRLGDNVQFTNPRTGSVTAGHVVKIAVKFVTIKTSGSLWKVPASMLSKVEGALN